MSAFSIALRNRSEQSALERVLAALDAQSVRAEETILISDRAPESMRHGLRHITTAFTTPGALLNHACQELRSELIVHICVPALPLGPRFIETLLAPFSDPDIVAVRCINVCATRELQSWMEPRREPEPDSEASVLLSPNDNCFAMRRSAWVRIPFDAAVSASCDKLWARRQLQAGARLAVCNAFYFLPEQHGLAAKLAVFNRQNLDYYLATGRLIRHDPTTLGGLLRACLLTAPKAATRIALSELGRYVAITSLPLQASWARRSTRE